MGIFSYLSVFIIYYFHRFVNSFLIIILQIKFFSEKSICGNDDRIIAMILYADKSEKALQDKAFSLWLYFY